MPYTDFHYTPTGTGVISGKEVLEQTEDAINDLGTQISGDVQTAIDTANNALNTANSASADAQNAVNTANTAYTTATNAQNTANTAQNTASNALTAAQNAQNDVNALGNRVTTAENNITQNTTNISGLTTRMGTAEGNITTLQNDVVTAQGTATSAQNTATTARQQSYVFRYSSTAITDNSTIAYSTIDNTDNIKSGDKILDVDGKLFEITAVDTANQTVTVGSALIDLALDANVVHTSGNETISGDKVFNNRLIRNIDVVLGTAPSTGKFSNIDIADNNKASLLQVVGGVYDTGNSYARFFVQNKTADDGSGLSPTGTLRGCGFNINLPANSTLEGQGSITPRSNKTTDFGLLNYQWRNLWCEKLFLNGTQLDPSAFVTTDTNQTVGGDKTFSDKINQNLPFKMAGDSSYVTGSKINYLYDQNGHECGNDTIVYNTSRNLRRSWSLINSSSGVDISGGINFIVSASGTKIFYPISDSDTDIGTGSAYWKNTYTKLVNGLTPSSLSLPSNTGYVDISGYFTNTGDGQTNSYTASVNGWIYLNVVATRLIMQIRNSNDNNIYADMRVSSSDGTIYMTIPIGSGNKLLTQWFTSSSVTVTTARFIPCQGNI